MKLINKWLDIMEKDLEDDHGGCRVDGVLSCLGYKKRFNHGCPPCEQCKKESQDIIAKIRKEASEQTVEYINLDALDSLKYKLKEKYDVLFNKFEVTEFERGELDAFTQTLYMIDDIMEKQATSDKTSDKTSYIEEQMRELSRKPLHDAETIARALEKVNNQSDKVNHPSHYNVHKHECIDEMIALFGVDETMAFCKLNAWKYRYRAGAKDGEAREKDLAKADWYIDKYMELKGTIACKNCRN